MDSTSLKDGPKNEDKNIIFKKKKLKNIIKKMIKKNM